MRIRAMLMGAVLVTAGLPAAAAELPPPQGGQAPVSRVSGKKLIRWAAELTNKTRASEVPEKVSAWQDSGYDGLCFSIVSHRKGAENDALHAGMFFRWWNLTRRTRAEFAPEIAAFKSVEDWGRLTDNFLLTAVRPLGGRCPDWFNDEDFDIVCANAGLAASIANEIGFKGLVLDTEQYPFAAKGPWRYPWSYSAYRSAYTSCGHEQPLPFAEVAAKVRERGRQYAQALSAAFPQITLLVYPGWYESAWYASAYAWYDCAWSTSHNAKPLSHEDHQGLFPAFIDGLLLGLSEDALIACLSSASYTMSEYRDMAVQKDVAKQQALVLSTVPDIAARRLSFAPGLWTDAQAGAGGFSNTDPKANRRDPECHEHATANALAVSDHYVWHYGETSYFLQWGEGYPFQPGFDRRYAEPPPLIREYWQANERAHEPHSLFWVPEPAYDSRDYAEFDAQGALDDEEFWRQKEAEGFESVVTLPEHWRFAYGREMSGRTADTSSLIRFARGSWMWVSSRKCWQSQGIRAGGPAFYGVEFDVPAGLDVASRQVSIAFPPCAEQSVRIYLNDAAIGFLPQAPVIDVTAKIRPGEKNTVVLAFPSTSGPGGLAGQVKILSRGRE